MYTLDTTSFANKWLFTAGNRTHYATDSQLAHLLQISERTARRWRNDPQQAPRYALDYAAAHWLGLLVPDRWIVKGLFFDAGKRLTFDNGESFALNCLENCDYMHRLAGTAEPSPCRKRRARHDCDDLAPIQALLFAPDDPPALRQPLN